MAGKLFLHIGRNKAGSTTLQTAWLDNADALRAAGIDYALFGQQSPPGHDLHSFQSHMALADAVQDRPSGAVLVSHEGLCRFQPVFAEAMARDLAALDMTLIFYVRPYRDWVVSDYVFNVLIGEQAGDFDSYLDSLGQDVRFWPALKIWGDAIGWDRVRVRSLHPDDLVGGDLAVDGMAAIGVTGLLGPPAARQNGSPAWVSTELIRFFLAAPSATGRPIERHDLASVLRIGERIDRAVRIAAASQSLPLGRGRYLTADQSARLRDLYDQDLRILANYIGRRLRHDDEPGPGLRLFLPGVDHIPRDLLDALQARIGRGPARRDLADVIGDRAIEAFLSVGRDGR